MGCGGRATWRFTWTSGSPLRPPPLLQSSSSHFSSSQPSSSPSSSSPHRRRHRRHRRRGRLRRRRRRPRRRHLRLGFPGATRTTRQPELGPPGLCLGSLGLRQGGGPPPAAVASGHQNLLYSPFPPFPSLLSPPPSSLPPSPPPLPPSLPLPLPPLPHFPPSSPRVERQLQARLPLYRSSNGVIVSPGFEGGGLEELC